MPLPRWTRASPGASELTLAGRADVTRQLPRRLRDEVLRPRLFDLLDAGVREQALTLVSAPPGAGKTVLLSSWLRQRPPASPVVWLTLHEGERTSLWGPILAAVGGAEPDVEPVEGGSGLAEQLSALLADLDAPLVLVLDDLHNATSATLATLDRLLHAPPAQLRIVASSRLDPPLALHVLRLTGDLAEVRAHDLAFTEEEARELFASFALEISDSELKTVLDRTEGWAAGLRLLALSLRGKDDRDAAFENLILDERPVFEFLAAEVLAMQTPETRSFLLRTSLADTLDGELANVLTDRSDGERTLDNLHRDNVFLERLPGGLGSYRYHQLFRALLLAEAAYELGPELPELHERLAVLLAQRGQPIEAIRHAVAASRWDLVSTLLADHWAGALAAGPELLADVPTEYAAASPVVGAYSGLLRLVSGDGRRASALLSGSAKTRDEVPPAAREGLEALTRYASALASRGRADFGQAAELSEAQIERAPVDATSATDEDHRRALGLATLGASQLWQGARAGAQASLEEAIALARSTKDTAAEADALAHLARIELDEGRLRRASRLAAAALELDDGGTTPRRPSSLVARTVLALAQHTWGDDAAARASLAGAEEIARRTGDVPGRALAVLVAAELGASSGGDAAEDALLQLRAVRSRSPAAGHALVAGDLAALEGRLLAGTGQLEAAGRVLDEADDDARVAVSAARLRLAQGEPAQALSVLGGRPPGGPTVEIEALVTESVAHVAAGNVGEAERSLAAALAAAEPEIIRRPFLDAGLQMRTMLVEHLRTTNANRWLTTELVAAYDGRIEQGNAAPAELLEPLSEREREVLRYLPTIMSNADIAAELFVSVNTVKTHVKSIYRKLGATRRQEAVRCARQLRLL